MRNRRSDRLAYRSDFRIRLARPSIGEEELHAIEEVLKSGVLTNGPATQAFERAFAGYHGTSEAVAFANGTVALTAMYLVAGIGPGDEVIVPSMTFVSSATSLLHVGATPVFAEVEPESFNIDVCHAKQLVTKRTKAILAVHYGGQPADLPALRSLANDADIMLLEDAAEAHGASLGAQMVGGWGAAGMFSFTPTKNITTGEGGMVTINDSEAANELRLLRNHGQTSAYCHERLGYNWRMTEMQAAIGLVQLKKLHSIVERKRENAAWMANRLGGLASVRLPAELPTRRHVYMLYTLMVEKGRDNVMNHFLDKGIEARIYFPPVHKQPLFSDQAPCLPRTEEIASRMLSVPFHARLTANELEEIADTLECAIEKYA